MSKRGFAVRSRSAPLSHRSARSERLLETMNTPLAPCDDDAQVVDGNALFLRNKLDALVVSGDLDAE